MLKKRFKERYFTDKNIEIISKKLLKKLYKFRKKREINFNITHTALIIVDLQKYFTDINAKAFIPSVKPVIKKIISLLTFFVNNKRPVVITLHIDKIFKSNMMIKWWKNAIDSPDQFIPDDSILNFFWNLNETKENLNKIKSKEDFRNLIIEKIKNLNYKEIFELFDNIFLLKKFNYDPFYESSLEQFLKLKKVTTVVICGVMTHLCCETAVRSAFVRNFNVLFPVDATATYNLKFHFSSIYNLSHGFSIPLLSDEILFFKKDKNN